MCGDKNRISVSKVAFYYEDVKEIELNQKTVERQAEFLISNEKKNMGDITVIFCSDDYLLKINEEYLGHQYYTDIITFDYCENSLISGDLFISLERVAYNAQQYSTSFKKELYRVIFHGLLHLIGYKDKVTSEKKTMRLKEDYYLKGIDFDKEKV